MQLKPVNVNQIHVTLSSDNRMRHAPIEVQAGCSWADLTIDGAEELVRSLQVAIHSAKKAQNQNREVESLLRLPLHEVRS